MVRSDITHKVFNRHLELYPRQRSSRSALTGRLGRYPLGTAGRARICAPEAQRDLFCARGAWDSEDLRSAWTRDVEDVAQRVIHKISAYTR